MHYSVRRVALHPFGLVRYTADSVGSPGVRADQPGIRESCALFVHSLRRDPGSVKDPPMAGLWYPLPNPLCVKGGVSGVVGARGAGLMAVGVLAWCGVRE